MPEISIATKEIIASFLYLFVIAVFGYAALHETKEEKELFDGI